MSGTTILAWIEFWFEFGSSCSHLSVMRIEAAAARAGVSVQWRPFGELGLPQAQIIDAALSESNKLRLRLQTETAALRGIFGAPTFFVGDDMLWGNDRLDEARAFRTPRADPRACT